MKEAWKNNKMLAVIFLVIMTGLCIYSPVSGALLTPAFIIALMITAGTFLLNLVVDSYLLPLEILLAGAAPAGIFAIAECYTHDLNEMWPGPVPFNLLLYYLFFALLLFLTGRPAAAISIEAVVIGLAGLANYFVVLFRSSPIFPWDLYSAGVAMSVADNFRYTLSIRALNVLLGLIAVICISLKMKSRIRKIPLRAAAAFLCLAAFLLSCRYVQTDEAAIRHQFDTTLFTPRVYYRNNGLILSFIVNLRYIHIEKPPGYSAAEAERILKGAGAAGRMQDTDAQSLRPNIIVVMNEAFSDLSVLGDYQTSEPVTPFIDSLSGNTQKGWYYSSVKGGNTANTELEFLTGCSLYFLPVGSVAYQQYLREDLPALPRQLSSLGYTTIGMHPYYPRGWNRDKVYGYLGFDETYFLDDFEDPEILRLYVSDQATYDTIIERYEEKEEDERLFVFDVTMQNHGSYWRMYDNFVPDVRVIGGEGRYLSSTEQYLSLIKRSDEAFEDLVGFFEDEEEPTIILMFGDHQPADYVVSAIEDIDESSLEGSQFRYKVPYVLWANFDIEEKNKDMTSANYMGTSLLQTAGLPLTPFEQFLQKLSAEVPVITGNMAIDAEGTFYKRNDKALADVLREYAILQYNYLADTRHRINDSFD